jgi:hypothetical protein
MDRPELKDCTFLYSQVGDYNSMVNKINTDVGNDTEVKKCFLQLINSIENSSEIGVYEKKDALDNIKKILNNLSNPKDKQDTEEMTYYWKRVVDIIKDIGQILPIARSLGQLIGYPVP